MDLSAFYAQFREETADNVRTIADGLLALERTPDDRAALDGVFRAAHTVKGSARLLGFASVANLAHAMESLLDALRAGTLVLSSALSDLLLQSNDALLTLATAASENRAVAVDTAPLIAQLERAATAPGPVAGPTVASAAPLLVGASVTARSAPPARVAVDVPTPAAPAVPSAPGSSNPPAQPVAQAQPAVPSGPRAQRATVRVRVDRLDRLVAVAGELAVGQQEDSIYLQQLQTLTALVKQQQRTIQALTSEVRQTRMLASQRQPLQQRLADLHTVSGEMNQIVRTQQEGYVRRSAAHALLVDELEAEVFAARLVPVATVFATLPRAIRELARSLNKQVELELRGEETEADRKVLDALGDPLLHMVRNAIDHGLEPADERERLGKSPTGRITVSATAEHGQLRIAVVDDGRGMDPARLRAVALRKGLLDETVAKTLSDSESLDLIFMPGFSVSPIITDVSGRGVGMDVVRSRMIELGGQVLVDSVLGQGSTITLVLPVSLMTSQVLLVEAGKQIWALPSRSCQGVLRLDRDSVRRLEGQPLLQVDGRTVPVMALADLLNLPADATPLNTRNHALLIGTTRPVAVLVDRLVDEREVIVKPLGPFFAAHPLTSGAAPLPNGSLAVVLSVQGLINQTRALATGAGRANGRAASLAVKRASRTHRLLITDDSFTTRELLRSILQSAGYEVVTAVDGQDALDKLRVDSRFDLVVSDVEMPRLDGFGLTASIRADQSLTHLPVIIVTSLHSDAHKRQGILAGAQAYIVKSQFDQSNLLAAVRDLLGAAS